MTQKMIENLNLLRADYQEKLKARKVSQKRLSDYKADLPALARLEDELTQTYSPLEKAKTDLLDALITEGNQNDE